MTTRTSRTRGPAGAIAGLSLIEVLIAIVVLATGMLALAALQGAIARASADAKARTQLTAFAESTLEVARGHSFGGLTAASLSSTVSDDALEALAQRAGVEIGAISFDVDLMVPSGTGWGAADPSDPPGANDPQMKQVTISITWTDAQGNTHQDDGDFPATVYMDMVSPLTLSENETLVDRPVNNTTPGPVVRRVTPEGAGMIPIALGNGDETAATNPRPELVGNQQNTLVSDTRFEVLTYHEEGDSLALIQQLVETAVVGCKCQNDTDGFGNDDVGDFIGNRAFRPTYWNGNAYAEPAMVPASDYEPTTSPVPNGNGNNGFQQSELCDVCCRDHQDPSGVDGPKFDPYRAAEGGADSSHVHYKLDSSNALVVAGTGEDYIEACRVIRVNGIWRVASDLHGQHFAQLATLNLTSPNIQINGSEPSADAKTNYQQFVVNYLSSRYFSASATTEIAGSGVNPSSNDATAGTMDDALDSSDVALRVGSPPDQRYLHARGLYVDYLEPEAIARINQVRKTTGCSTVTCILPYLPFTTINATELATWVGSTSTTADTTSNAWLAVNNILASASDYGYGTLLTKGLASASSAAPSSANAHANYARSRMTNSNSGVAMFRAIDTDDALAANQKSDSQTFTISGSGGSGDTVSFSVAIPGYLGATDEDSVNDPHVLLASGEGPGNGCVSNAQSNSNTRVVTPWACESYTPETTTAHILVGNNNYVVNRTLANPCKVKNNDPNTVTFKQCVTTPISSADLTRSGVTSALSIGLVDSSRSGKLNEQTQVTLPTPTLGDLVTVTYGASSAAPGTTTTKPSTTTVSSGTFPEVGTYVCSVGQGGAGVFTQNSPLPCE